MKDQISFEEGRLFAKKLDENDCEKTLGIQMGLSMKRDEQFSIMVQRMKEMITKLQNVTIIAPTAHIFFNIYLLTKVYFGYRIISLIQQ